MSGRTKRNAIMLAVLLTVGKRLPNRRQFPWDAAEDREGLAAFRFHAAKRSKNYADSERTHDPNRK